MLYTLIIDYKGGTYITQSVANNVTIAPGECIKNWDNAGSEIKDEDIHEILNQLKDETFMPLKGLKNIWCGTATINNDLMLLNLVETSNAT